jgi:hypothetical protein
MDRPGGRWCAFDWFWFLAWALASSLWCWTAARQLGATFDEPVYIARGLEHWRTGSYQGLMQLGTMPLAIDLDTLPIYIWERWQGIRFDPVHDLDRLLPWARRGTLVFWWLLLFYGRLAGRQLAGPWGGRLAVALLACEPSLLAHASLATTDLAVTACLLAMVYHYRTEREAGWVRRVALPALWFAATLLAKASGLVFGPLCLLVVEWEYFLSRRSSRLPTWSGRVSSELSAIGPSARVPEYQRTSVRHAHIATAPHPGEPAPETLPANPGLLASLALFRRDLVHIMGIGLLLTFLYCGSDWRAEPSFVQWAHHLPAGPGGRMIVWLAEHLRTFSNAGEGLVRQVKHNVRGHGTYLLGKVADRSIWYYFPVALSIKLSLPLLMLPLLVLLLRPRYLANWATLTALALLAFSVNCRVQIGIRLVLPLVALAVVGLAAAAVRAWAEARARAPARSANSFGSFALLRSRPLALVLGTGVLWSAVEAAAVWPNGLCYANELWGGTAKCYLRLSDSNYDWGQGLKELARWQHKHPEAPLDVWYFGTDPVLNTLPAREVRFHTLAIRRPEEVRKRVGGHYLAVSTTLLHGSVSTLLRPGSPEWNSYWSVRTFLESCRPVDRTMTFLIYDFREDGWKANVASASGAPFTAMPGAPVR